MAVTTSSKPQQRQRKSTARSLSDLENLLQQTANHSPFVNSSSSESTTMNTSAQSTAQNQSAQEAFQAAAQSLAAEAGNSTEMLSTIQALFASMVTEIGEQTKQASEEVAGHMTEAIKPLSDIINQNVLDTGELKQKVASLTDEVEKIKKEAAAKAAPADTKETSVWLRTANVIKDIGAYSGAAILVGISGKVIYDTVFTKNED